MKTEDKTNGLLNANILKFIAIICMLSDHIAWTWIDTFSPLGTIMHTLGRITIPIMCFFVAEGFYLTKDRNRYILRMFFFCVLSHVPYCLLFNIDILFAGTSVMLPLISGLLALCVYKNENIKIYLKIPLILLLCASAYSSDWEFFPVLWILFFGIFRDRPLLKYSVFVAISLFACGWYLYKNNNYYFMFGLFLALPLLLLYNGKRGRKNFVTKWGFYIFYPLHMIILYIISLILGGIQ